MSSSVDAGAARPLEQHTFDEWPPALRALFDGTALASKIGFTASLITCDASGHLRTSLVGIGELYAPDSRHLAFALWPNSRTARALALPGQPAAHSSGAGRINREPLAATATRHGHQRARAALTFVYDEAFYQVQLGVDVLANADADADASAAAAAAAGGGGGAEAEIAELPGSGLAQFIASIDAGEMQQVGYARLTSGVAFELSGEASEQHAVLDRWSRQIERLREAAHAQLPAGSAAGA
jgi:hypothetical protein